MNSPAEILHRSLWQKGAVYCSAILLASSHWLVTTPDKFVHNLLYHLDFVPILIAAMLFGWRSAVVACLLTLIAEYPHLWTVWRNDSAYRMDQVGETLTSGIAGVVVGLLVSREQRQRARLERTSKELAIVNEKLRENLERLAKAERMYAVAQLSASLAHEIRNPLASISGAAGILRRGHANAQNTEECLQIIEKESNRLNKLLANFLNFARPRAPRFQQTDLRAVISATIALARHSGQADGIEFRPRCDTSLPEVQCDPEQMKQVLLNLVMNAVHATGTGVIDLEACTRDGLAIIAVRDQGSGVPKEQEKHMFEPFFTTKANGTGLGLAIAAQIVEQHGGKLEAQNSPGRGLTMVLELPVAQEFR